MGGTKLQRMALKSTQFTMFAVRAVRRFSSSAPSRKCSQDGYLNDPPQRL
jgi:hypothetical protein